MAYQFIHVEAYSREVSKQKSKGKGGLSVRQVIAEAGREPGNCPHVQEPEPPEILFGSLQIAEEQANIWAAQATDAQGRKLRKDGHCLLAGVISLPREEEKNWSEFSKSSIQYLKKKYGERLKCVISHEKDEKHPHIHFYVVPLIGERFELIHEGQKAAKSAKSEGKLKGEQNAAYISAMRKLQDDFSEKVGQPFGLTRLGPGRRRLSRATWQREQSQAKALQDVEKTAKGRHLFYKEQGYEAGLQKAENEDKKAGSKVGAWFSGAFEAWHSPSLKAIADAELVLKRAKKAQEKTKQQADRTIQEEQNHRQQLAKELEKYKNIAANSEQENERLRAEIGIWKEQKNYEIDSKIKPK